MESATGTEDTLVTKEASDLGKMQPSIDHTRSSLLVGATGLVGSHCLQLLLENSTYGSVIILTRKALPLRHEKLTQHLVDFDDIERFKHLIRVDDVFCCLGTTIKKAGSQEAFEKVDYTYPLRIASIARTNGAKQFFIVTSLGANPSSSVFYYRVKGRVEDAASVIPFNSVHIFRPSMLLGTRNEFRWQDAVVPPIMRTLSFVMVGRWRKYRAIQASTVAFAMVNIALQQLAGVHVWESDQIQHTSDQYTGVDT